MKLADDIRSLARKWSVQLHGLMIVIASLYEIMPALDPAIAKMLPADQQMKAIGIYALVGLLVRIIKQKGNG